MLNPYIKSTQIWKCPSNSYNWSIAADNINGAIISTNYQWATNGGCPTDAFADSGPCSTSLAQVPRPAETFNLVEGGTENTPAVNPDHWAGDGVDYGPSNTCAHLGTGNFLFCDGHVKALKWSTVYQGSPNYYWSFDGTTGGGIQYTSTTPPSALPSTCS